MRLAYIIPVVAMLFLAAATPGHALYGKWPDLNMTYSIDDGCRDGYRDQTILHAIEKWAAWLPEITWTATNSNPRLMIFCLETETIPEASLTIAPTCFTMPDGHTFLFCMLRIAKGTWTVVGWEDPANLIAHEIGHILGLSGHTRGLMNGEPPFTPTDEELAEIRNAYGLPVPEFPTSLLWLLIVLFAFWTPIMRRKKQTR